MLDWIDRRIREIDDASVGLLRRAVSFLAVFWLFIVGGLIVIAPFVGMIIATLVLATALPAAFGFLVVLVGISVTLMAMFVAIEWTDK